MFVVTTKARIRLSQKLDRRQADSTQTFRFAARPGGWRLRLDRPRPADTAITHDGQTVLVLDEAVWDAMKSRSLDVIDTESGPRLRLQRLSSGGD